MKAWPARLDWARDGADWPHRQHSQFVLDQGLRWHVQRMGASGAPVALLIHGTGAASHSWRALMPLLAEDFEVIAIDLPGHGFTDMPARGGLSLPAMAASLGSLLRTLRLEPALAVGHSAGAAIAVRLRLDGGLCRARLVSINGALLPLRGIAGRISSPLAKVLAANPLVPRLFAWRAADAQVLQRLLDATGSVLDGEGKRLYGTLVANPGHAAAALGMMAAWDLGALRAALPGLAVCLHLIVGLNDRTVPPAQARELQTLVKQTRLIELPGLGHLAHEEQPLAVWCAVQRACAFSAVPPG